MTKHKGKQSCHTRETKDISPSQSNRAIGTDRHSSHSKENYQSYRPEGHYSEPESSSTGSSKQCCGSHQCSSHQNKMRQGERENQAMRGNSPRNEERDYYYGTSGGECCNDSQDMRRHEMNYQHHPESCGQYSRSYQEERQGRNSGPIFREETREELEYRHYCEKKELEERENYNRAHHRGSEFEGQYGNPKNPSKRSSI